MWKIFPDEQFEGEYYVDPDAFADALRAGAESGLSALNMSIGGTQSSSIEQVLIRRLIARGVVVVAAMGNEFQDGNPIEYPAAYDGVLAVGASPRIASAPTSRTQDATSGSAPRARTSSRRSRAGAPRSDRSGSTRPGAARRWPRRM